MTQSLDTSLTLTGKVYTHKHYGQIASVKYDRARDCYVFMADSKCPWHAMELHSIETADWLALAYAAHLAATGH